MRDDGMLHVLDANPPESLRAKVQQASIMAMLEEGLKAEQAFVGNKMGDAKDKAMEVAKGAAAGAVAGAKEGGAAGAAAGAKAGAMDAMKK